MPIIVDEIVISIDVGDVQAGPPDGANDRALASSPDDRQALVNECAERVLEVLRERAER